MSSSSRAEASRAASETGAEPAGATTSADKPPDYFANARDDIVLLLATGRDSAVLELGCGAGATGRAVLEAGKAGIYVGVELDPAAAEAAAACLTRVLVGDVEHIALDDLAGQFDALIISEVLEHLADPWTTLRRLCACLKSGGMVFASSPNIAHWHVVRDLIGGRFDYRASGVMDRTHLRWFTPSSYRDLFEGAGFEIDEPKSLRPPGWKVKVFDAITGGRFRHLSMTQIMVVGRRC